MRGENGRSLFNNYEVSVWEDKEMLWRWMMTMAAQRGLDATDLYT